MFYFANENAERVRLQISSIIDRPLLANMFDVFAITRYYIFKATRPFADTLVKECLWQLLPRSDYCTF